MVNYSTLNYYLGCALIAIMILAIIGLIFCVKKLIKNQQDIIESLSGIESSLNTVSNYLFSISSDTYEIMRKRNG